MVLEDNKHSIGAQKQSKIRFIKRWRVLLFVGLLSLLFLVFALLFTLQYFPITQNYSKQYLKRVSKFINIGIPAQQDTIFTSNSFVVHGIDVSHHNKLIDWNLVKYISKSTDTLSFVFIKATEGRDHLDTLFLYNWESSKRTNLIRGAYHYFKTNVPAETQAKLFIERVPLTSGDLPPVIDVEESRFGWKYALEFEVLKMARVLEDHYKVKPIIYISHNYYELYFNTPLFASYPFWIARYNNHHRLLNLDFWKFWQHTEVGSVGGVKGAVDINVFVGSFEELKAITLK